MEVFEIIPYEVGERVVWPIVFICFVFVKKS